MDGDRSLCHVRGFDSINAVACCYDDGTGIKKDVSRAFELDLKAAELGNSHAQANLSICYELGSGTSADPKQQFYWLQKAVLNENVVEARFTSYAGRLAECYEKGVGTSVNFLEAIRWYAKSNASESIKRLFEDNADEMALIIVSQQEKIDDLEKIVVELECRPGGPEFFKAKEEFKKLSGLSSFQRRSTLLETTYNEQKPSSL